MILPLLSAVVHVVCGTAVYCVMLLKMKKIITNLCDNLNYYL